MSDADDANSDFDKQAERERLREKYERDKEGRRETQRMSELLLQGATMTNSHCEDCGNPIFRYDGQEFCSVCDDPQAAGAEAEQTTAAAETGTSTDDDSAESTTSSSPQDHSRQQPTVSPAQPTDTEPRGDGDVEAARAALVSTLVSLAEAARTTEDLGRRRDQLRAATEAAEAIAAVDRIR